MFYFADTVNSNSNVNPMKTKRIKCVIQPTSSYVDGACVDAHQLDSPRTTVSGVSHLSSTNLPLTNIISQDKRDERTEAIVFSDCITPKASPQGET